MTPSTSGMRCQGGVGQGGALFGEALQADVVGLEGQVQAERLVGGLQDVQGGGGDFGADAVAGQDQDVTTHGVPFFVRGWWTTV